MLDLIAIILHKRKAGGKNEKSLKMDLQCPNKLYCKEEEIYNVEYEIKITLVIRLRIYLYIYNSLKLGDKIILQNS